MYEDVRKSNRGWLRDNQNQEVDGDGELTIGRQAIGKGRKRRIKAKKGEEEREKERKRADKLSPNLYQHPFDPETITPCRVTFSVSHPRASHIT